MHCTPPLVASAAVDQLATGTLHAVDVVLGHRMPTLSHLATASLHAESSHVFVHINI